MMDLRPDCIYLKSSARVSGDFYRGGREIFGEHLILYDFSLKVSHQKFPIQCPHSVSMFVARATWKLLYSVPDLVLLANGFGRW